jgi:hypothetical protein
VTAPLQLGGDAVDELGDGVAGAAPKRRDLGDRKRLGRHCAG